MYFDMTLAIGAMGVFWECLEMEASKGLAKVLQTGWMDALFRELEECHVLWHV